MHGPYDEQLTTTERTGEPGEVHAPSTPGGKLLVPLQLLEARGYEEATTGAIDACLLERHLNQWTECYLGCSSHGREDL